MVLNFKGVPYTQSWVSYPDIAPLLKAYDIPPGNNPAMPYTLPAISHKGSITSNKDGVLMDSEPIAMYIDKLYPSPPLFPSGDASYSLLVAVHKILSLSLMSPSLRQLIIPNVASSLDPRGQEYFIRTRSVMFGKPLSEVRPTDEAELSGLWQIVEKETEPLLKMLKGREGKKGPFLEGEKAGYADFVLASVLAWIHRFDRESYDKILVLGNGEFKALYDACLPWLEGQGEEREWPIPQ
jgi:glutathione S-transferase